MKNIFTAGVLVILLPHLGQAQAAREELLTAESKFGAQLARSGSQAAFLNYSTPQSLVVDKGVPAPAQEHWKARRSEAGTQLTRRPVLADVAQSGELGYTTGPWTYSKQGAVVAGGDYVTLWRKQPDGQWKHALETNVEHMGSGAPEPGDVARPQAFMAAATPVPVPTEAILALDRKFAAAELKAPQRTYADNLSTEARLYRTDQLPLVGPAARVATETLVRAYAFVPTGGYLAASGDLGYVYGTLRRPALDPRQPNETGTYLRIWRRESAAGWRIVAEVINNGSGVPSLATASDAGATPSLPLQGGRGQ